MLIYLQGHIYLIWHGESLNYGLKGINHKLETLKKKKTHFNILDKIMLNYILI